MRKQDDANNSARCCLLGVHVPVPVVVVVDRVDRLLRSAPHILVQPLDVVEKRLSLLRKVLGLSPSPELEKVKKDYACVAFVLFGGLFCSGGLGVSTNGCTRHTTLACFLFAGENVLIFGSGLLCLYPISSLSLPLAEIVYGTTFLTSNATR